MRTSQRWGLALGLAIWAVTGIGCNRHARREPVHEPNERAAGSRSSRSAVTTIANARCEREQRCGNIGVDSKFASRDACVERVRADWANDLNARECPAGVREVELDECLEDIREEDCGDPFDSLERVMSCATVEICAG